MRRTTIMMIIFCWAYCSLALPFLIVFVIAAAQVHDTRWTVAWVGMYIVTQPAGFMGVLAGLMKTVRATWASIVVFSTCIGLSLVLNGVAMGVMDEAFMVRSCEAFQLLQDCSRAPAFTRGFLIGSIVFLVIVGVCGLMVHARFLRMVYALKKWHYQKLGPQGEAGDQQTEL